MILFHIAHSAIWGRSMESSRGASRGVPVQEPEHWVYQPFVSSERGRDVSWEKILAIVISTLFECFKWLTTNSVYATFLGEICGISMRRDATDLFYLMIKCVVELQVGECVFGRY